MVDQGSIQGVVFGVDMRAYLVVLEYGYVDFLLPLFAPLRLPWLDKHIALHFPQMETNGWSPLLWMGLMFQVCLPPTYLNLDELLYFKG